MGQGNDHRGATWFDTKSRVMWLLAYRLHRSGSPDDFFPYAKALDAAGRLFPTEADYERMIRERDHRFIQAVRIEAPLVREQAIKTREEQRVMLGGELGACVSIEIADDLRELTVAFATTSVPWDLVPIILQCFWVSQDWSPAERLPSRPLEAGEVAFRCMYEQEDHGPV